MSNALVIKSTTGYFRMAARYKDPMVNLLDQGIVSAANFLTIVLVARRLSLVDFGLFMVAQTLLILLTSLQNALITQPHNILGAQREGTEYARLTLTLGLLQIALSAAFAAVAAICGFILLLAASYRYAHIAFSLAAIVLPWMGQEFVRRVLYTHGDAIGAAINDFVSYGLQVAGIAIVTGTAIGIEATPANALLALGGSSLVAMLFGWRQLRRNTSLRSISLRPKWRSSRIAIANYAETWRMSKWLLAQQSATLLGASGNGWLLTAFLGPASFGVYRAAYQIVNILNPLRQAAMNHLPSRAARVFSARGIEGLMRWNKSAVFALTVPFALLALAIVLGAEPLAHLIYGHKQLLNLHFIVAMGAISYTLNFARAPLDYTVLISGGGRALCVRALWLAAFVLTCGVLLIWSFGIYGAMLSEVAVAILATSITLRVYASATRAKTPPQEISMSIANTSLQQETRTSYRTANLAPGFSSVVASESCPS